MKEPMPKPQELMEVIKSSFEINNLVYNYPGKKNDGAAVNGVNLSLAPRQLCVLLGANGSGKTTTLKLVSGMLPLQAGEVKIGGIALKESPRAYKQKLAFVPDFNILYGKLKAYEYIEMMSSLWGILPEKNKIMNLFASLKIEDKAGSYCDTLSRGMQQKISLMGALIHNPSVLVLDEPFTGLDILAIKDVKIVLQKFAENGGTVLLSTHILPLAESIATHVAFMKTGKIKVFSSVEDLKKDLPKMDLENIVLDQFYSKEVI